MTPEIEKDTPQDNKGYATQSVANFILNKEETEAFPWNVGQEKNIHCLHCFLNTVFKVLFRTIRQEKGRKRYIDKVKFNLFFYL